jgi:prepilin-type N-terminal cleavage/methylation domain-containing protein
MLLGWPPVKITAEHTPPTDSPPSRTADGGFTLIELMLVLLIFTVLTAAALSLSIGAQSSLWNVQGSSSLLDSGLRTLTLMKQDISLAGHPAWGSFTAAAVASHPGIVATSFTTATGYDLVFQGDVNGNGQVEQVEYTLPAGSQTLMRLVTPINPNGSVAVGSTVSQSLLSNVQNQLTGQPVFSWSTDPFSQNPFPQNIQTVYVNLVLQTSSGGSSSAARLALATACERMNP